MYTLLTDQEDVSNHNNAKEVEMDRPHPEEGEGKHH